MQTKTKSGPAKKVVPLIVILVVIVAVIAVAWYQEQIGFFFTLRGWDKEGPSRAVSGFLEAGKKGDQEAAGRFLEAETFRPHTKDGKWAGYLLPTNAGTLEFLFSDLTPAEGTRPTSTEFVYMGKGAAMVSMPDSKGKDVVYRLEMIGNTWKVTEIRAGNVVR